LRNNSQIQIKPADQDPVSSGVIPGGGVFRRATKMLQELDKELSNTERQGAAQNPSSAPVTTPLPVQIKGARTWAAADCSEYYSKRPIQYPQTTAPSDAEIRDEPQQNRHDAQKHCIGDANKRPARSRWQPAADVDDAAQRISRYLLRQLIRSSPRWSAADLAGRRALVAGREDPRAQAAS
jgi:hypothetical protein